ncbi:MAG: hypothetical protein CL798_02275 [Chromatiales bacterium]|nr:hypothetical protein [Chromatiales bacterium]
MLVVSKRITSLDVASLASGLGYEAGRRRINELFERAEPAGAIFCSYDNTAIGVLDGARIDRQLSIPDDLSVIGNRVTASWGAHEITTVGYPLEDVVE